MRTNIYVDGFNFYYGCLRDTSYRWLNFEIFCKLTFPGMRFTGSGILPPACEHLSTTRRSRSARRPTSVPCKPFPP
jgi:hypothetical protein